MKKATLQEWLGRGIENIYPSSNYLNKILSSKKKFTIYIGADATGSQLHLGHATNLLILKHLQNLGHKIIFLIGDFTAMIGDPTDKMATRIPLTRAQVLENCKNYKRQVGKILKFDGKNPAVIKFNSKWLNKMSFKDLIQIASHLSVNYLLTRDMFQERMKLGKNIGLHEFLYPLMQGYDSVAMNIDAEMGGNDQTFNMLIGRDLVKKMLNKEKIVITTKLLVNPKTGKKIMNKSEGSYVGLDDEAGEMFGKVMSLPDEVIIPCFTMCTEIADTEINKIQKKLDSGENPKNIKVMLAKEIVAMYHSAEMAKNAEADFNRQFKDKEIPFDIPEFKIKKQKIQLIDLLVETKMVTSKSEARRLIEQRGVKIDKTIIGDVNEEIEIYNNLILQVGKRKFVKLIEK